MQGMAVLLLELSYGLNHKQGDQSDVKKSVKLMLHWLGAMRHIDAVVERAHKVVIRILQQHKFKTIFSELLAGHNPAHEQTQHVAPSFVHSHPEPTAYPASENVTQMPPAERYAGLYAAYTQPESGISNPTSTEHRLFAGLGQSQAQQPLLPQMNQMPSQAEQYQNFENPHNNQFMFSNPFMTSYDQDAPFGLTPDNLWPGAGVSGHEGLAEQHGVGYPNYPYMMNQNPTDGPQQPQ